MKKKKKTLQEAGMGYCPYFSKFESQYSKLYCDIGLDRQGLGDGPGRAAGAQGRAAGAQGRAAGAQGRAAAWPATIQPAGPRYSPRHGQGRPRHGRRRARGLAGGECVTIQLLYRDRSEGLASWGWVTIQSIVS